MGIIVLLFACTDDYERSAGGEIVAEAPVLNMLGQNAFLLAHPETSESDLFLFRTSWARPRISYENGLPCEVSNLQYQVEAGLLGEEFATAVTIEETSQLFFDMYTSNMYQVAEQLLGEDFEAPVNLELRVVATYDGLEEALTSNSITVVLQQEVVEEPEEPVELTIRFKQTAGDWDEFAVYAWGESEVYGGWPGLKLDSDANGWYAFTVPVNRPINLIINNNGGGQQFDFLADPTEDACYEFDTGAGTWTAVDCPGLPITIRWKYVGTDWTTSAIYAWGGDPLGETFGGWPGAVGTPDTEGWCSVTVDAGQAVGNVIFNNGTGGDGGQFDLGMTITEDICFEITSDSYTVVNCE